MELTTRELAILLWGAGFILWLTIRHPKVRTSLSGVLRALFQRALLGPIIFLALYVFVITWGLEVMGFWNWDLLIATILWFLFSGVVMAFSIAEKPGEEHWVRKLVGRSVGALLLVEFLAGTYTFPFVVEAILVPLLALAGAVIGLASSEERYSRVREFTEGVMAVAAVTILGFSLNQAARDLQNLANPQTAKELMLPVILTFLLVPAVVPLALQSGYEQIFLRLRLNESRWYRLKARFLLVLQIGLRPRRIAQFREEKLQAMAILRSGDDFRKFIGDLASWDPA